MPTQKSRLWIYHRSKGLINIFNFVNMNYLCVVNYGKRNNISSALSNKCLEIIYFLELLLDLQNFDKIYLNMEVPKPYCR